MYTIFFDVWQGNENKVLQMQTVSQSREVARDNDAEHKLRMKAYANRNSLESKVEVGERVVLKHENRSKLDPNIKPERFTVTGLSGSDMVVSSEEDGKVIRRNVSCAKKLQSSGGTVGAENPQGEAGEGLEKSKSSVLVESSKPARVSGRDCRMPVRFRDYHMY